MAYLDGRRPRVLPHLLPCRRTSTSALIHARLPVAGPSPHRSRPRGVIMAVSCLPVLVLGVGAPAPVLALGAVG